MSQLKFVVACPSDEKAILRIARSYPDDFSTYIAALPGMIRAERVFVAKSGAKVLAFATYGVGSDQRECMTATARAPEVSRAEVSGDWLRSNLEKVLTQKGFKKFTAHVRPSNANATKMLLRNGYMQRSPATNGLLEFTKVNIS